MLIYAMSSSYSPLENEEQSATNVNRTTSPNSDYSEDFEPNSCCSKTPSPKDLTLTLPRENSPKNENSIRKARKTTAFRRRRVRFRRTKDQPNVGSLASLPSLHVNGIAGELLYAKQLKMNEIQDELVVTRKKYQKMQKENRILKTFQQKQEKAIRKFEHKESELPRLISEHSQEQRVLRFRLKVALSEERKLELKMRENIDNMSKMEEVLCRLKALVKENNLGERSELARKLADKQRDLAAAEERIEKLNRQFELYTSSFLRQIDAEKRKHKETLKKLEETEEVCVATKTKLGEKVRALNDANIYAFRTAKCARPKTKTVATMAPSLEIIRKELSPTLDKMISPPPECASQMLESTRSSKSVTSENTRLEIAEIPAASPTCTPDRPPTIASERSDSEPVQNSSLRSNNSAESEPRPRITSLSTVSETQAAIEDSKPPSNLVAAKFNPPSLSYCCIPRCNSYCTEAGDDCQIDSVCSLTRCKTSDALSRSERAGRETSPKCQPSAHAMIQGGGSKARDLVSAPNVIQVVAKIAPNVIPVGAKPSEVAMITNGDGETDNFPTVTRPKKSYQFSKEIQNLHLGIPSSIEGCKKKLDNLEKQVLYFGSYSPTFGGSPTRKKYLSVGEYKPASAAKTAEKKAEEERQRSQKKSDLLLKLFGKLEIEKDKLPDDESGIRDETQSPKLENRVQHTTGTRHAPILSDHPKNARKYYKTSTNVHDNGDNFGAQVNPQFRKDFVFLDENIEDRPG